MKSPFEASAEAYCNGDFITILTYSNSMVSFAEPDAVPRYLAIDAESHLIGQQLRLALAESKHVSVEDFHKILASGVIQTMSKARIESEMKQYGYKSKRAFQKNMNCCWINKKSNEIVIKPTLHRSLDGYSGISVDGPEILHLDLSCSDAELGAALREGFSRCTSSL